MGMVFHAIIGCAMFATASLQAGTLEAVSAMHIEPGDVGTAQVRLFPGVVPQLYIVLSAKKFPSYAALIRQNFGHPTRIYVCGELLSEATLTETDITSEITFLVPPQVALDLAQQLTKKNTKPSPGP